MIIDQPEEADAMYLRPGNLPKDFFVEHKIQMTNERGRVRADYDSESRELIHAVLAQASTAEKERWDQLQHPITHTIVQRGRPAACPEDRMIHGSRTFYIQGVDEVGELGIVTIYYAEERSDTRADNDNNSVIRR